MVVIPNEQRDLDRRSPCYVDYFPSFVAFVSSLENTGAGMIRATNWHAVPVIPAKAGIHPSLPWMPAFAGMTNQGKNHVVLRAAISYSVDERKLMDTLWCKIVPQSFRKIDKSTP